LVNFGETQVGTKVKKEVSIANKSKSKVTLNLRADDPSSIRIVPIRLNLK
jgi:hypothetical protein